MFVCVCRVTAPQLNQYQSCMLSVGEVLVEYDKDKKIGALGFGAILPGKSEASHNFALSGSPQNVEVDGVEGLLGAYSNCLQVICKS